MPIDRAIANITILLDKQGSTTLADPLTDGSLREMYEMLLDAASDHIFLVTTDARLVYANIATIDAIAAGSGITRQRTEIIGQNMRELGYPESFLSEFLKNLERAAGGEIVAAETTFPSSSGISRSYEYTLSPVFSEDGTILVVVGVTRDVDVRKITNRERQELLEAEQRARKEAETAVRVRDDFLSSAAHDLKTPLTAAQGRVQLLMRQIGRGDTPDIMKITTQANAIQAAITQMALQIGELQDIAFLQIGRPLELAEETTDLAALVRRAAERNARDDRFYELVELEFAQEPIIATFDRIRIERVLDNLLSNAFKYSGTQKTITVRAWIEDAADPPRCCVSVTDNGIGIPKDDLPLIFERFHRASNVEGRTGIGLGLSGARKIARQHGGDIDVASVQGVGSTVTLWLPIAGVKVDLV
jgi:PAS domain S-box-containing protein